MTACLNKFIDRVQGQEARGAKDFVMTMADAKGMCADLTRLLLEVHDLREQAKTAGQQEVVEIKIGGGTF